MAVAAQTLSNNDDMQSTPYLKIKQNAMDEGTAELAHFDHL